MEKMDETTASSVFQLSYFEKQLKFFNKFMPVSEQLQDLNIMMNIS